MNDNNKVNIEQNVSIDKVENENGIYPGSKNSNLLKVMFFVLIILGAGAYILINKINKDKENAIECEEVFDITESECVDNNCSISIDEKKYKINASYPKVLISAFDYVDYITIKVCLGNDSINSYKLINTNTNEEINVTNTNDLRKALGLKIAGEYNETATLVSFDSDFDIETEDIEGIVKTYKTYYLILTFSNNETEELIYKIEEGSNITINPSDFESGKKYTVKYEVTEDSFGNIQFTLLDIK